MVIDDNFSSIRTIMIEGEIHVTGRLVDASNATLYARAVKDGSDIACIYKPIAGERPLWDFSDGTLADREYAAYLVSQKTGLDVVPITILREGPFGLGMVQRWIDIDEGVDLVEIFNKDLPQLRKIALFDAIVNNTDRKIGHLLPTDDGKIFACDHGVTFHVDDKLRTVLWQWAQSPLAESEMEILQMLASELSGDFGETLQSHLTFQEIDALLRRVQMLLTQRTFPLPSKDWPSVPWPAY